LYLKRALDVKLVFKGASGYRAASAMSSTVVHLVVTGGLSKATVRHGKTVTLTGMVMPAIAGEQVTREQLVGGKWVVGPTKTIDAEGGYSFVLKGVKKKTTQTYRVVIAAGHGLAAGVSPTVVLAVT
jgi:hypothetical protein